MAEIDLMEYSSDSSAQAAYVTNATYAKYLGNDDVGTSALSANVVVLIKYAATGGTVNKIRVYSTADGNAKVALYTDSSGTPNSLIASGSGATVANQWNDIAVTPVVLANGTDYWLAMNGDTTGVRTSITLAIAPRKYKTGQTYATWTFPSTFDNTGFTDDTNSLSISAYGIPLEVKSESTIKTQGSYALKAVATTGAFNKTLTKTF